MSSYDDGSDHWSDPAVSGVEDPSPGAREMVVVAGMSAISGAVMGFLLAGAFEAAFFVLPAAILAGWLGWLARSWL